MHRQHLIFEVEFLRSVRGAMDEDKYSYWRLVPQSKLDSRYVDFYVLINIWVS